MFTVKQDTCYTKWMRNHLLLSLALRIIIRFWFSLSLVRTEWIKIMGHYLWIPTHTTIWKATMHVELGSATNELFSGSAVRFKNIELSTEKWKSKKKNQNFQVWSLTSFLVWHQTKKVIGTLLWIFVVHIFTISSNIYWIPTFPFLFKPYRTKELCAEIMTPGFLFSELCFEPPRKQRCHFFISYFSQFWSDLWQYNLYKVWTEFSKLSISVSGKWI